MNEQETQNKIKELTKELETANKKINDLINNLLWLRQDMIYKAPEQVFEMIYEKWIPYIDIITNPNNNKES